MAALPFVKASKAEARLIRARLKRAGVLRNGFKTFSDELSVYFPVFDDPYLKDEGFEMVLVNTQGEPPVPRLEQVKQVLPVELRPLMTRAFDRIGEVLILRLDEALEAYHAQLGQALLETHPGIRTVALDRGVAGPYRLRELEVLAGEKELVSEHREFGLRFQVDLARCYFSPRLATERDRITKLARPGERVVDMFAGVGPFSVALAKRAAVGKVIACEWNPEACKWLRRNLTLNKVEDRVEVRQGDVATTLVETAWADRVILNHPTAALDFLELAGQVVKTGGQLHLYTISVKTEITVITKALITTLKPSYNNIIINVNELHGFSKSASYFVFDITV